MKGSELRIFIEDLLNQNRTIKEKLKKGNKSLMRDYSEMYVMGKIDGYLNILEVIEK